jgi:hypothetical protein
MKSLVKFVQRQYAKHGLRVGKPGFMGEAFRTSRGAHAGGIHDAMEAHINTATIVVLLTQLVFLLCVGYLLREKYRTSR